MYPYLTTLRHSVFISSNRSTQGTHEEILKFVEQFGCKDKLEWFKKGHVNGAKTREVFSFLKHKLPSEDGTTDVRWNFAKFLVDHEGNAYKRFRYVKYCTCIVKRNLQMVRYITFIGSRLLTQ